MGGCRVDLDNISQPVALEAARNLHIRQYAACEGSGVGKCDPPGFAKQLPPSIVKHMVYA